MHQQIRTVLGRSGTNTGSGAMESVPIEGDPLEVAETAIDDLLELLAGNGYNLCLAGGNAIEAGGEFVFAIDHEEGDTKTAECARLLEAEGYQRVRLVAPHVCWISDEPGELLRCLRDAKAGDHQVREVFVGTQKDGRYLIHVNSVRRGPRTDG